MREGAGPVLCPTGMLAVLLQAWALAAGGLSSLGSALIVIMLLERKGGPASGYAFGLGYLAAYMAIGLAGVSLGPELIGGASEPSTAGGVLALCFGLLLAFAALQVWRAPPSSEPPALLAKLDELHPPKALAIALFIPLINVKNLAIFTPAIAVLADAELAPLQAALGVLSTAAVFCAGLLTPLMVYTLMPGRSARWLGSMRGWIERNSHKVARSVLPLVAALLIAKGLRSLWPELL